jgi:hypothetical protein
MDTLTPLPTQEGKLAKEHYSYKKPEGSRGNGSCALLAAIVEIPLSEII